MINDHYQGVIERFREHLPIAPDVKAITLLEGNTPLIPLKNFVKNLPVKTECFAKFEGLNPTASFKDRGMTVAVSQAVYEGATAVICASTGNTSAAAAAYAARAGITAFVIIPEGNIAMGKLAQAVMYGAHVLQIRGNFDQGLAMVKSVAQELPLTIVNSINPYRIQGQKTAAFEVVETLGFAPDYHCVPVGNACNISSYWKGYQEYAERNKISRLPRMLGYQAEHAAPFIQGKMVDNPDTVATAIRIGHPQSWDIAHQAQQQSAGWFAAVSDQQILDAQYELAATEGIFCEPAAAATIAGFLQDVHAGKITDGSSVVFTLTGHGLKDPQVAIDRCQDAIFTTDAELDQVADFIKQRLP